MFVKHPQGYASVGITRDSRVETVEALSSARSSAPRTPTAPRWWRSSSRAASSPCSWPSRGRARPSRSPSMPPWRSPSRRTRRSSTSTSSGSTRRARPLGQAEGRRSGSRSAAAAHGGAAVHPSIGTTGYARLDLRQAADGALHVLETNPNCGVFYPEGAYGCADLILAGEPPGHRGFLEHIIAVRAPPARRARAPVADVPRARPRPRVRSLRARAARPRRRGAAGGEEQPRIASSHARLLCGHGGRCSQAWFRRYAWPLTDEVHALWSDDPEQWRPINHSCDPNTWLQRPRPRRAPRDRRGRGADRRLRDVRRAGDGAVRVLVRCAGLPRRRQSRRRSAAGRDRRRLRGARLGPRPAPQGPDGRAGGRGNVLPATLPGRSCASAT